MKYAKMLGAAAMVAASLMVIAGAGNASATVLCKVKPVEGSPATKGTVCPATQAYGKGTEIHAVIDPGADVAITEPGQKADVTCKKSTLKSILENEGSDVETVKSQNAALTFEECSSPIHNETVCTVTTLKLGTLEVHWIPDTFNGTLTANGIEITSNCQSLFGQIHCIYQMEGLDLGTVTGGVMAEEKATIDIVSGALKEVPTNSLCPIEPILTAQYEVTSPKPLYVAGHT